MKRRLIASRDVAKRAEEAAKRQEEAAKRQEETRRKSADEAIRHAQEFTKREEEARRKATEEAAKLTEAAAKFEDERQRLEAQLEEVLSVDVRIQQIRRVLRSLESDPSIKLKAIAFLVKEAPAEAVASTTEALGPEDL